MLRPILALLLGLSLATGALAQPPTAAPEPAAPAQAPAPPPTASPKAPPASATPPPPKISFRPSETISEDTAVPFPADI
ncbi:MAG: hypothetical protein AMXMBFR26_16810 [Porticoccaceae bacterium]